MFKNILQYTLFFMLIICGGPLFADDNGQIININQNYQIAFTDLGSRVLSEGDIVKVSLSGDEFIYMQVLESSAILSKLGPSKVEGFQTNLNDLQRMVVGNEVVKINQAQEKINNPPATETSGDELSQQQIEKLKRDLNVAKEEIKRLEESNEESKVKLSELALENQAKSQETVPPAKVENQQILEQLKTHLENMRKLIDEN